MLAEWGLTAFSFLMRWMTFTIVGSGPVALVVCRPQGVGIA